MRGSAGAQRLPENHRSFSVEQGSPERPVFESATVLAKHFWTLVVTRPAAAIAGAFCATLVRRSDSAQAVTRAVARYRTSRDLLCARI